MASAPAVPSIPQFDEATQKELQNFVEQQQAHALMQSKIHEYTEMCWDKCITGTPGGRFSRGEEACLVNCVDRFFDSAVFLHKRLREMQGGRS